VTVAWRRTTKCIKHKDDDGSFVRACLLWKASTEFPKSSDKWIGVISYKRIFTEKIYLCVLGH